MTRVLVTGGTGFVGWAIVDELLRTKHEVRLLTRREPSSQAPSASGAKVFQGNVLKPASLELPCAGVDAVIHLVGIISEVGNQTFESVHTCGTANIVEAARNAGFRRFIHMSALGTRPNAVARYHKSKWAAEEVVRAGGLDWTIFRPSIIFGPGDGFANLFARLSRFSPVVPIPGSGRTRFQPVHVEDVARSFVRALNEPRAIGRTLDLCGPETRTLEEIIDQVLRTAGRRRLKWRIPLWLARTQAAVAEFLFATLLRKPPPLNRDQLIMLQEDSVGDTESWKDLLQITPRPFSGSLDYLRGSA